MPDLQRRIWRRNDHGLSPHSQGTVLAAAALLQSDLRSDRGGIRLATFGCPLKHLYGWAFPAYFGDAVLGRIGPNGAKRGRSPSGTTSATRPTPACGPVPSPAVDLPWRDPATSWRIYDDQPPTPGGHSGYWTDSRVWDDIDLLSRP